MQISLAPLYYGLLIILSIFFYNNVDEDSLIEGSQNFYQTLTEKSEELKELVVDYFGAEIEKLGLVTESIVAEENTETVCSDENSSALTYLTPVTQPVYDKFVGFVESSRNSLDKYFEKHPEFADKISKIWVAVNVYVSMVYEFIKEKWVVGFEIVKDSSTQLYNFLAEKIEIVTQKEPIKTYLSIIVKFQKDNVSPVYEHTIEVCKKYLLEVNDFMLEKATENKDTLYGLAIIFVVIYFFGYFILFSYRKIAYMFVKDTYELNKAVEDMWKTPVGSNSEYSVDHTATYLDIKNKSHGGLEVDELAELEEKYALDDENDNSNASNRRQEQSDKASNRTIEQQQETESSEEIEEEREKEINEIIIESAELIESIQTIPANTTCINNNNINTNEANDTKSTISNKSNHTTTTIQTSTTTNTNTSNGVSKLMYVASKSVIYDESDKMNSNIDLSGSAVSGITLEFDREIQKITTTSNGDESDARSSVRSLLE